MPHGPTGRIDMPMVSPTLTATRTTAWTIAEYVDTGASGVEADYSPKGRYSIAKQAASSRALRANKLIALPLLSGLGGVAVEAGGKRVLRSRWRRRKGRLNWRAA